MLPAYRPATSWVHNSTSCNTQSSAPEVGRDLRPKHVEMTGIINKLLLLHLVGVYIIYVGDNCAQCSENFLCSDNKHRHWLKDTYGWRFQNLPCYLIAKERNQILEMYVYWTTTWLRKTPCVSWILTYLVLIQIQCAIERILQSTVEPAITRKLFEFWRGFLRVKVAWWFCSPALIAANESFGWRGKGVGFVKGSSIREGGMKSYQRHLC